MVVKDLIELNNAVRMLYFVEGYSIDEKKCKISVNRYNYPNRIYLYIIDKKGRENLSPHWIICLPPNENDSFYKSISPFGKRTIIFFSKDDAYNFVMSKIRNERRSLNEKLLNVQLAYSKSKEEEV